MIRLSQDKITFRNSMFVLTLVTGLSLTLAAFIAVRQFMANNRQVEFEKDAAWCGDFVREYFDGYVREVENLQIFFENCNEVTRDEFRNFTMSLISSHPDVQAVCWVPRIASAQKGAYELKARSEGFEGFRFHTKPVKNVLSDEPPPFLDPVYYCEPYAGNEMLYGLNVSVDPEWRGVLSAAAEEGRFKVQAHLAALGFKPEARALVCPVYQKDGVAFTAAGRRQNLEGFIVMIVDLSQGLTGKLEDYADNLDIRLENGRTENEAAQPLAICLSARQACERKPMLEQASEIQFADQKWQLRLFLVGDYLGAVTRSIPYLLMVGGGVFTVLAALYLVSLMNQKHRTEMLVAERTSQLEQEKEKARQWAERAEEANQTKSLFLANMSHEVRTPMNAIIGFAEILAEEPLDDMQLDYVQTICDSAKTLLSLINDILDVSKIEAGKMEIEWLQCPLADLLRHVERLLQPATDAKGLEFAVHLADDLPETLVIDPTRLRQCLINLVNNAVKFTETGHIFINASMEWNGVEQYIRFDIEDTGIGIPEDRQQAIFDAFTQSDSSTTRKYGGTGLGLTITRKLVRLMGGNLTLHSQVGRGSVFTMTFPWKNKMQAGISAPSKKS